MLPITLVLLVATSALAIPVINLGLVPVNQAGVAADNGRPVSGGAIDRAWIADLDEADQGAYILNLRNIMEQIGDNGDDESQGIAAAQTVGVLIKLADGIPGDNCYTAALINAVASCDSAAVGPALRRYIDVTMAGIDHIVQLDTNPRAAKYSRGLGIGCLGGGREFALEAAWDGILANANSNNVNSLSQEYCAVKRLYQSNALRSNNVAAAATAGALEPVVNVFIRALGPVANFIRSIGTANVARAAANAKAALNAAV